MPDVEFFTRQGCQLCEEALHLLHGQGISPKIIDIDEHPEYLAEFDTCVPVVRIGGKVRFRGRVNPLLLRRVLKG